MMNTIEILEELESNGSRNAKEEILERNVTNELLKAILVASLDPYVHYNVRKFKMPKPNVQLGEVREEGGLRAFVEVVLPKLSSRQVTGNAAKKLVEDALVNMTPLAQKWAKRVLLQNLRAGIQSKTVNKTWPDLIKGFEVQLAKSLDTSHDGNNVTINGTVNYPVRVEPKLDGLRCVAVKQNGEVNMFTRNGRLIETLPTIKAVLEACKFDNFVLDGEAMGEDWNESASVIGSKKTKKDDSTMFFNVFDSIPLDDWKAQNCSLTLTQRQVHASDIVNAANSKHVRAVPGYVANNEEELIAVYERCLDEGHEGVMVKDMNGLYTFKRTDSMLKMKPVATYEGTVVGHYLGRDGTRHQGKFGGFDILLPNGVITRVGGGFSDAERAEFQVAGYETFVGKIMEVEGQPPLTKEGKVRFPVFTRWRDASDVDPAIMEAYENFTSKV